MVWGEFRLVGVRAGNDRCVDSVFAHGLAQAREIFKVFLFHVKMGYDVFVVVKLMNNVKVTKNALSKLV